MKKIKLFCFGFGQVAKYFVKKLINDKFLLESKFKEYENMFEQVIKKYEK